MAACLWLVLPCGHCCWDRLSFGVWRARAGFSEADIFAGIGGVDAGYIQLVSRPIRDATCTRHVGESLR
jgi:hypothetical protein